MAERAIEIRTGRGFDRLVNFSDATVAIAITLLVLPLVDLATGLGDSRDFGAFLGRNVGSVIAFVITFIVIARFWIVHHRVFELVTGYTRAIVRVNFLWLLGIVALPFAANALSFTRDGDVGAVAAYIGTLIWIGGTMLGMEAIIRRVPSLLREEHRSGFVLSGSYALLLLLSLALLLAVFVPAVGIWALLLLVLTDPAERLFRRLLRERGAR